MSLSGFETTKSTRTKLSRAHIESMRPRARQIVEAFVSNISDNSYDDRVAQNTFFYLQEALQNNPEVFRLMFQEVRKLPRTSAQQQMMQIINTAQSRGKRRKRREQK
ncbi:MAG: hypothetical protein JRN21_09290 [Nitrososphaerota archaeon]|nr:hypothetical protein [Nitrososphaerota archaeon]